jgi:hypothetical protein
MMRLTMLFLCAIICPMLANDFFPAPPLMERRESPNKQWAFEIRMVKRSDVLSSEGSLLHLIHRDKTDVWQTTWTLSLPNRYRPHFFLVNDAGFVATFDDWELTKSDHVIVIYTPSGKTVHDMSFNDLMLALKEDVGVIMQNSKPGLGWWMSDNPVLFRGDSTIAVIGVAGRKLFIELSTGKLMFPQ